VSAASSAVEPAASALRKSNGAPTRSVIDAWLTINGNLQSEGDVQVDGQIEVDIRCAHLTVGRDALVNGNITAEEVVVRGKVMGCIRANRVILQDCAHVESEVFHKKLSIEEGACFEGRSRRYEDPLNAELPGAKPAGKGDDKFFENEAVAA
jgi:cytoskeletal protein CcmA (bactofilin family)